MKQYDKNLSFFKYAVLGLVLIRGLLNALIPLMDKTEARYAEIARIMAETGNWITPQIDYNIPFWAKPPLSTWLSAVSFQLLGVSEFAARLPYLLLAVGLVFLIGKYAKRTQLPFFLPGFILLTIPEFLLHAGVVSTDTALAFCVALTMLSFWEAMQENSKWYWKYLIFVGLGLGLLAKGPIIGILALPPILLWTLFFGKTKLFFKNIPLILGSIVALVIAIPWYILAEIASPGFIDYFVVGEHFLRFFDSSWSGDKYGFPKSQPLGIIWGFLFVFVLPWFQILLSKLWQHRKGLLKHQWEVFLVLWLLWTPLFFTISKSLIHPYIMPVMVPVALLITHYWKAVRKREAIIVCCLTLPLLALFTCVFASFSGQLEYYANSDKYLIQDHVRKENRILHLNKKSYSSQFYSKGKVESITINELENIIKSNRHSFKIIIKNKQFKNLGIESKSKMKELGRNQKKTIYECFIE